MKIKKNPILKVEYVDKYYGNGTIITKALNQITFQINSGEFVCIMGPSGSGKTTLLNCISTIDSVSSGHIIIDEQDITDLTENDLAEFRRNNLGFVFQDFNLLDTLTVEENISLPLVLKKVDADIITNLVQQLATDLNLSDILNKFPSQISGGQKQRCAFVRAIITKPKLILADEPTGSLDSNSSKIVLESMCKLNINTNSTIIMVTHDALCASYSNRILFLKDGKIYNEIYKGEKNRYDYYHETLDVISSIGGNYLC